MTRASFGERLYALMLSLYPAPFSRRYRDDMLVFYRKHREDPRFAGPLGTLRFWRHTVVDLVRTARRERSEHRATRGPTGGWRSDARYAIRALRLDPLFTTIAVITIALGTGAATTVFSVAYGVLATPLDFPRAEQLARVYEREHDNAGAVMVAYGNYTDLKAEDQVFDELAIWTWGSRILTGVDEALPVRARSTSSNWSDTLRTAPARGRWFNEIEETNGDDVVVLSHTLWRDAFGSRESILGETAVLDGSPYVVVGVMPPGFDYPFADAWVPLQPLTDPTGLRRWHRHNMLGRLADGVAAPAANRMLADVSARIEADNPVTNAGNYFEAIPLIDDLVGSVRPALQVLLAGVATFLLIACVNLTSVTLARAASRGPELAVRRALGGTGLRIGRMLLIESLAVAALGGVLGVALATLGVSTVHSLASGSIPRIDRVALSYPVLGFALAVTLATGLAVGLVPALRAARGRDLSASAVLSSGRSTSAPAVIRMRRLLVVAQLALALVLTVSAGLLVRSLNALQTVDLGAETTSLAALNLRLPSGPTYGGAAGAQFMHEVIDAIESLPSVERAGAVLTPPATPGSWGNNLTIRDRPVPEAELPPILYNVVSAGYFETLRVPVLSGRGLRPSDPEASGPVVVINRAAAERYWPGESPLGKEILGTGDERVPWMRVVGVVENVRQAVRRPAQPEAYVPMAQDWIFNYVVLARVAGDPLVAAGNARDAIRAINPDVPVMQLGSFEGRLHVANAQPRFNATLMSAFAAVALVISCVGVYGVLAYTVATRRREFGIRVAVGATGRNVLGSVVREALVLSGVALVLGVMGAMLVSGMLTELLFGVEPMDATTIASSAAVILAVAMGASLWPARAAVRVDPVEVLRNE